MSSSSRLDMATQRIDTEKDWEKGREGWMCGVTFEGDISVLYYNDKKE
jgi:hypothetical protein